jgi:hypothetical protein
MPPRRNGAARPVLSQLAELDDATGVAERQQAAERGVEDTEHDDTCARAEGEHQRADHDEPGL